ncbi:cytochrome P450 6k1-like [Leptopilina heterotoma]|uniref:cytochrome P450 6k1-like n=1 Tax=Leptopilina heterotoma TaxID=63436 RepID=UPI001CAA1A84|nr:cytochrome P450 6k1-like [Leptopilina heterotoma]
MALIAILCIVAVILLFLYVYSSKNHDFWKKQGVKGPDPLPILGNFKDILLNRLSPGEMAKNLYNQFNDESMIGIYARSTPILLLKDPELIKDILIKDFNKFAARDLPVNEEIEPLSQNLLNLEPKRWRPLRKKLSPVFTSGKLREMFFLLLESGNHFETYLRKIVPKNEPIECRLLTSKFTMDVIGSCAFGIDINTLSDEENDFVRMGRKIFVLDFWRSIKAKIRDFSPGLFTLLGPIMKDEELDNFFISLIRDTMKYRKENNVVRHDFVDLLRYVKENPEKMDDVELTDTLIAAQCFIFFAAGFETSSTTMSNSLYELALNPSVQDKLRNEIQQVLNKSEGKLTYDNVKSMKYLHKVFQETLRKYPPATLLGRKASEKYTFSGTNVTIPKDSKVWIPVYAIHRDPKNYPKPELFDPERFEDEEINSRHPMLYLPFGEGPRNCIGARFAIFQTKIGLIKILQNYRVEECEKTPKEYVIDPSAFLLAPKEGIYLKFTEIP